MGLSSEDKAEWETILSTPRNELEREVFHLRKVFREMNDTARCDSMFLVTSDCVGDGYIRCQKKMSHVGDCEATVDGKVYKHK